MFTLVGNFDKKKLFYCTRQNIFAPQTSIFIMLPITGNKQNLGVTDYCKRQIETSKNIFGSTAEGTARKYYPYVKTFTVSAYFASCIGSEVMLVFEYTQKIILC